jgi:hypothetical protein
MGVAAVSIPDVTRRQIERAPSPLRRASTGVIETGVIETGVIETGVIEIGVMDIDVIAIGVIGMIEANNSTSPGSQADSECIDSSPSSW